MDLHLSNKTALVSGSTAGIGLAIVEGLAREGATVYLNGRTQARVDQALHRIRGKQPYAKVHGVAADLGASEGAHALFGSLANVDILINNLGIFQPKEFQDISDEEWQRFFEVNVLSGIRLSRHYLAGMRDRNWGRIIFISSEAARAESSWFSVRTTPSIWCCIASIFSRMLRMISTPARFTPNSRVSCRMISSRSKSCSPRAPAHLSNRVSSGCNR